MAYDPLDQQAFQIANDLSLPPEQRKAMIDELYAQPPQELPPVPSLGDVGATAAAPMSPMSPQELVDVANAGPPPSPPPPPPAAHAAQPMTDLQRRMTPVEPPPAVPQQAPPSAGAPGAIRFVGQPGAQQQGGFQLPQMPAQRTVKVGTNKFQPAQRNIQTQFAPKLSEETEAALQEAEIAEGQATIKAAEAGIEAGKEVALRQNMVEGYKAGLADEQAKRDRGRAAEMQRYEQRYRDFSDEAALQSKITPPKWSDSFSSRIAVALGALGSAISGQPNQVWEMVKSEIDNDIMAQRENAELLGRRAEQERTLYQMAKERFGDDRLAELSALEEAYRQADQQLAQFADSAKTPERQAALEGLRAQVQREVIETSAKRELAQQDQIAISEAQKFDPVRYQTTGGDPLKQLKYTLDLVNTSKALGKALAPQQAVDPSHKLYIPGLGYARTHQDAQSMREMQANYEETMRGFDEAEKYISEPSAAVGAFGRGTSEYHSAGALTQQLAMGTAKSYGGVVTATDIANAKKEVPDLTAIGGGQKEKLKVAREKFIRRYESQIKSKVTAQPPENVGPEPRQEAPQ